VTDDAVFLSNTGEALADLPTVEAVALGGSRAQNTHRADSDWDFAIYYRGDFQPQDLRDLEWEGEVSAVGEWGGGVFNGGAWLTIDERRVDVHYRDLEVVEHEIGEARAGRFHFEPLLFHLAGIPSYLIVGELATNRVLHGALPRQEYPAALRTTARDWWTERAELNLDYARQQHAARGRTTQCAGLLAVAACEFAHAILASRGEWVANEKSLLERAGLGHVDRVITTIGTERESLDAAVTAVSKLGHDQLQRH
jgi:predicted nucleotidyltransferase